MPVNTTKTIAKTIARDNFCPCANRSGYVEDRDI